MGYCEHLIFFLESRNIFNEDEEIDKEYNPPQRDQKSSKAWNQPTPKKNRSKQQKPPALTPLQRENTGKKTPHTASRSGKKKTKKRDKGTVAQNP